VVLSRVVDPAPDVVVSVEVDPEAVPDVPVPMVEDPVVEEPVVLEPVPVPVPVPEPAPPAPLPPVVCASAGPATSARAAIEVYRVFFMITLRLQCSWKRNLPGRH
jgi:hypothetical protein